MLENYFEAPFTLQRLRSGPSGKYIDGFAKELKHKGYAQGTARRYLRASAHLGQFTKVKGIEFNNVNVKTLKDFGRHLPKCGCPQSNGGTSDDVIRGARQFVDYLKSHSVLAEVEFEEKEEHVPELIESFRHWLRIHRGASESTIDRYGKKAVVLLNECGDAPDKYTAQSLRGFILNMAKRLGRGSIKDLISASRMFLRYLAVVGECQVGLDKAIPKIAGWRQSSLPGWLTPSELKRLFDTCDIETHMGTRDRAILLLLARLGLRASDVAKLSFLDIDWKNGSFLVSGKGRDEVRMPLPQEVGDAILAYLEHRPQAEYDKIFLRMVAPFRPLKPRSVSLIVTRNMRRAEITAPRYGSHILRYTAATEMLRQGIPLYEIGSVLRHRSLDMTAHYAKVDIALLKQIALPWPEVIR